MQIKDKTIIFSSQYFGSIIYYWSLMHAKSVTVEAYENYQKRSVRNRCKILNSNGPLTLSVPLQKGKNKQVAIRDVKIAYNDNWQEQHLSAFNSSYGNSAFYYYYKDDIAHIINQGFTHLWELNEACMAWCLNKTGITKLPVLSTRYKHTYDLDLRNFDSEVYRQLQSCMNKQLKYAQVYEYKFGFVDSLSILDLLFCTGPESYLYLSNIAKSI